MSYVFVSISSLPYPLATKGSQFWQKITSYFCLPTLEVFDQILKNPEELIC